VEVENEVEVDPEVEVKVKVDGKWKSRRSGGPGEAGNEFEVDV
jgi:hypothetical protein